MLPFDKFLGSILLTIACLLVSGGAYPNSVSSKSPVVSLKYATGNRSQIVARDKIYLNAYQLPAKFQTFEKGIYHVLPPGPATFEETVTAIAKSQINTNINSANIKFQFQSGFSEGPRTFAYFRQTHRGVPFANAVANLALHDNKIVAFGSSFVRIIPRDIDPPVPSRDVQSVIPLAEKTLNGKFNGHATLEYYAKWSGYIHLVHVVQIQNVDKGTWFEAFMDAHNGNLITIIDFVAEASYKVVPISQRDLRGGQVTLADPQDASSSPMGWHNDGTTTTTSTDGNNVIAFEKTWRNQIVTTPETRTDLVFDYTYIDTLDPRLGKNNVDAARTNAFYVINMMHDIAYKYGFTEKSFNFQTNNFGKGGPENDRIRVQVQESGGNSARFHTPPDGQSGICQLHIRSKKFPRRDVAMDNGMIIHEFTHGITRRMVGGGTARCLRRPEAQGLGEGWSDAMAEWVQQKPIPPGSKSPLPDYVIGQYITGRAAGLRTYPYSISNDTNGLRYSSIKFFDNYPSNEHKIGEVWANMLHNVYAALVEKHGFSENARTDATTSEGNVVFMRLFIDALSLLPCNPTFLHARDAWIQADRVRHRGFNVCLLWKAFASRGLGVKAADFVDDSSVPPDCTQAPRTSL